MSSPKVVVIGCGIFGALASLRLVDSGLDVVVLDRGKDILSGASYNNQNRLHLGFHYPRDKATAEQCKNGFRIFIDQFRECVSEPFENGYFIADHGSFVTPEEYVSFCEDVGLRYREIDLSQFPLDVRGCRFGLYCDELVYDCDHLRGVIRDRLARGNVHVDTNNDVIDIRRIGDGYEVETSDGRKIGCDFVVNCSYADINRLTSKLGCETLERQFEYTVIAVVDLEIPKVGVTIMDGPFMTLLPFGNKPLFLLYHVTHTVVADHVGKVMDRRWLSKETAPFDARRDGAAFFERLRRACAEFVPVLEEARSVGFLQSPRMVLAHEEATDARPSVVVEEVPGYLTVFSGKIDHCVEAADHVVRLIEGRI